MPKSRLPARSGSLVCRFIFQQLKKRHLLGSCPLSARTVRTAHVWVVMRALKIAGARGPAKPARLAGTPGRPACPSTAASTYCGCLLLQERNMEIN